MIHFKIEIPIEHPNMSRPPPKRKVEYQAAQAKQGRSKVRIRVLCAP